jgi:DNA polymerase III epsilon subunit family exonuclease
MENGIEILDLLYKGLKFKEAVYTEKTNVCVMNFLYNPESFTPNEENKKNILTKIKDTIGDFVTFELNFTSCPLDKRAIANHTYTTIVNNFPALSKNFTYDDVSIDIDHLKVVVSLKLVPISYDHALSLNREQFIEDKLKESFFADFQVKFIKKEDEIEGQSQIEKNMELMASIKESEEKTVYELLNIADIIGKNEYSLAVDFTKITTALENVIICGEVTSVQKKTYKRKITKNKEETEIERTFYNFSIRNENKVLYCSIFPKQHDETKGDLIEVGMKVCCLGSFRDYKGKLNFTAFSIARCEYKREEIKSGFKHVNEEYHTIYPEKYIDYEQAGLFDDDSLSFDGTYVVFDLETTGLDATKEEIIEIGACKVVDGRIDETFSTFVKPSKRIPKEITDLTTITDEMVKDAPTINYVMPDFYKFCDGATLVCQNTAFDTSFIYNISKKLSYNFNHPTMDTMAMARQKLPGLKNYKLGTIVEKLNISLENAHRAIDDAVATAKAFIKLMNMK